MSSANKTASVASDDADASNKEEETNTEANEDDDVRDNEEETTGDDTGKAKKGGTQKDDNTPERKKSQRLQRIAAAKGRQSDGDDGDEVKAEEGEDDDNKKTPSVRKRTRIDQTQDVTAGNTHRQKRARLKLPPKDHFSETKKADEVARMPLQSSEQEEPVEDSFKNRCVEWYKQQPGALAEPTPRMMKLFGMGLKKLQKKSEEDLKDLVEMAFDDDEEMSKAFIAFLRSQPTKDVKKGPSMAGTITAFTSKYVNTGGVVDNFINYVDACHKEYKENFDTYHSPYISLCQSSGYGKSRLLQQVARHRKLLYICVGDSEASFPGPNIEACRFLFRNDGNDGERETYLVQKLICCVSWCMQNDLTAINQFDETPAEFWDDIISKSKSDLKEGDEALKGPDEALEEPDEPDLDDPDELDLDKPDKNLEEEKKKKKTIWIAFDEARSLLNENRNGSSDFRILRWALSRLSTATNHRVFAILVDTKSSIANFSPSKSVASSDRPQGIHLFHPYILISTHDALKDPHVVNFIDDWSFVKCGRPLWNSIYPNNPVSRKVMLDFATSKLSKKKIYDPINDDYLALLAIIICRTGVYLSPQSSLASELAANYMATLILCNHTHEKFLVTYLSDPVLTVASAKLWYETEDKKTKDNTLPVTRALPVLRQKLVHGAVLEGYLGELVGRLLLLLGMDSTNELKGKVVGYDGRWCHVSRFMECCFGITDCLVGEDAYVGFSHFIPLVEEPASYDELQELLYRRAACCLPPNQTGADLLIPFWKKTEAEPVISYILVQVKNFQRKQSDETMLSKLDPKVCFSKGSALREPLTDIILIMMEIGVNYKNQPNSVRIMGKQESSSDKKKSPSDKKKLSTEKKKSSTEKQKSQSDKKKSPTGTDKSPTDNSVDWKEWVYSVRGIHSKTYPFLLGQVDLSEEVVRLRKASLNIKEWMDVDEAENYPPTLPGMDTDIRQQDILKIRPKIMILNEVCVDDDDENQHATLDNPLQGTAITPSLPSNQLKGKDQWKNTDVQTNPRLQSLRSRSAKSQHLPSS